MTLASTVILAGITAWLAWLTKVMADSARTAAEHSRVAAEASLASVAAAEAAVDVRFDVQPIMGTTAGEMREALRLLEEVDGISDADEITPALLGKVTRWSRVELTCLGATVTVHGMDLTFVTIETGSDSDERGVWSEGKSCELALSSSGLPRLLHGGEKISFDVPDRPTDERLVDFSTTVRYSFGDGPVREREAKWRRPRPPKP